jgi:PAS domain S-box-containing protein
MDTAGKTDEQNILSEAVPSLSDIQKALLDATPDCIKVMSADGKLLLINRAGRTALNIPQGSEFGIPWLALLPQETREQAREALRKAAGGSVARFSGTSAAPDGTRYWDNLLTPLIEETGQVASILCVSRDVTEKTRLENALRDSISRERLLSREMQHRIKNIFSLVSGLIFIAERETGIRNAPPLVILREKIGALARASDAAFSSVDEGGNNGKTDLQACVKSVLKPYGDRCRISGGPASIGESTSTTLALVLHELATNSMKYGALSTETGNITVRWAQAGPGLNLLWTEDGGPDISAPPHQGFGSEMIERIVRSAGGTIQRNWRADGLSVVLDLPN